MSDQPKVSLSFSPDDPITDPDDRVTGEDLDPGDTEARESVEESASEPGEPTPYDLFLSGKLSYAEAVAADRRENPEEYYDEDENESGEIPGDMDDDED